MNIETSLLPSSAMNARQKELVSAVDKTAFFCPSQLAVKFVSDQGK